MGRPDGALPRCRNKGASQTPESAFTERYPVPVEPVPFLQCLSANALAEYYARLAREIEAESTARAKSERRGVFIERE